MIKLFPCASDEFDRHLKRDELHYLGHDYEVVDGGNILTTATHYAYFGKRGANLILADRKKHRYRGYREIN